MNKVKDLIDQWTTRINNLPTQDRPEEAKKILQELRDIMYSTGFDKGNETDGDSIRQNINDLLPLMDNKDYLDLVGHIFEKLRNK